MEKNLYQHGAIVLKFWMQIDKDEQERRFTERMNTPDKRWKITDEDWRNREKWDLYEKAVDDAGAPPRLTLHGLSRAINVSSMQG